MRPLSLKLALRTWLIASALSFYACAEEPRVCAINETRACTSLVSSTVSCSGRQMCNENQSGFLPCKCDENPGEDEVTTGEGSTTSADPTTGMTPDDGVGGVTGEEDPTTDSIGGGGSGDGDSAATTDISGDGDSAATTDISGDGDSAATTDTSGDGDSAATTDTSGDGEGDLDHGTVIFDGTGTAVPASDNDYGISGSFYVLQDSYAMGIKVSDGLTHTKLTPLAFNKSSVKPCVSGTIAKVTNAQGNTCTSGCQWGTLWGGLIGLELADGTRTWSAEEHNVSGFSFELSGSIGDARLRIEARVKGSDEDFCVMLDHDVDLSGHFSVGLDEFTHNCFDNSGTMSFDPTQIVALEWMVMSDAKSTSPVENFCVEGLDVN